MSLVRSLLRVVLSLVLDHPLSPVYPRFEGSQRHFLVDSGEPLRDSVQEVLSALTIVIRQYSFDMSKEKEVTWVRV
jgi:hypothetical protein